MLQAIDRELWIADGPSVSFFGIPYPTRMAVVRLSGGEVWLWSPIHIDEALRAAIDALGPVAHVVAPNKLHHLYLPEAKRAWPAAKLYAAPGLAARRPAIAFDAELGDVPDPAWAHDVDQAIFHGSFAMEEVVFFHRTSRTAIFADLIQRFDPATLRGWRRLVMTLDGMVGPQGSTPREWRASFWRRAAARRAKRAVLDWNPVRAVIAHGDWIRDDARAVIERALAWMG